MDNVTIAGRETEDRMAILDIEAEYGLRFDAGDATGFADLFTEDGVYQTLIVPGMPEPPPEMRGRAELAAGCTALPGACMHRLSSPKVSISGDEALTRSQLVFEWGHVDEHGVSHTRVLVASSHTEYVRTPDGWKIRRRVSTPYSITDSSRRVHPHEIEIPERN